MRRALALGLTLTVATLGTALLVAPLLPATATLAMLAPGQAQLQLAVAREALGDGTPGGSRLSTFFARRSIAAMPINQSALALAAETGGVADRTDALNLGAALGWRDELTNARLAGLALANGEVAIAAQRIDAIGRTLGGEAASTLADALMKQDGGPEALAGRAANRTGGLWWIVYLRRPAADSATLAQRARFASLLEADDGPWRRDIVAATLYGIGQSPVDEAAKGRLSAPLQALLQ